MSHLISIFYAFLWLVAWLPLGVLYILSDILFLITYYIARYRRKVVRQNLQNSFPQKSKKEIKRIERQFYLHFCDYIVEVIKLVHISPKTMQKRFKFKNLHVIDEYYAKNQNIILYLGHYGNWEWTIFAKAVQPNHNHEYKAYSVYQPLRNKSFDRFMLNLRSKSGSILVPQKKVLRTMLETQQNNTPGFFCFIADQRPGRNTDTFWMNWMSQDTQPVVGPERLAQKTNYPVVYFDIQKTKRGYYTGEFIVLTENPRELPPFELTKQYMHQMEKTISRNPAYWLWTHKRWKRKPKVD